MGFSGIKSFIFASLVRIAATVLPAVSLAMPNLAAAAAALDSPPASSPGSLSAPGYWQQEAHRGGSQPSLDEILKDIHAKQRRGEMLKTGEKALWLNANGLGGELLEIGAGQPLFEILDRAGRSARHITGAGSLLGKDRNNKVLGEIQSGYVTTGRLDKMLDHVTDTLRATYVNTPPSSPPAQFDPKTTRFYGFAVTAERREGDGHAWVGVRYQIEPHGPFNEMKFHLRLLNPAEFQSRVIGAFAVDLLYAIYNCDGDMGRFFELLGQNTIQRYQEEFAEHMDRGPYRWLFEADSAHFSGTHIDGWSDASAAIELVQRGFARAVMLEPPGRLVPASSLVRNKGLVIHQMSSKGPVPGERDWRAARELVAAETGIKPSDIVQANLYSVVDVATPGAILGALGRTPQPLILSKPKHWNNLDAIAATLRLRGGVALLAGDGTEIETAKNAVILDPPGPFTIAIKKMPADCEATLAAKPAAEPSLGPVQSRDSFAAKRRHRQNE
jgi:hypothetical protein